jgi:CBS domain-containing protein
MERKMLIVRDIMTTNVLALEPQMSLRDAMELLAEKHISGAPVVSGKELVGVISAADLLAFAAELSGTPPMLEDRSEEHALRDSWGDELESGDSAANFFVDFWPDAGADVSARFAAAEGPDWNRLEEHTVSEAMTTGHLCTLPSTAPAKAAAECMGRLSIRRVLVVDDGALVGIVTSTDITKAAAESRLSSKVYLFPPKGTA